MPKFIELTNSYQQPFYVNIDKIITISVDGCGSEVFVGEGYYPCCEHPTEILQKIKDVEE